MEVTVRGTIPLLLACCVVCAGQAACRAEESGVVARDGFEEGLDGWGGYRSRRENAVRMERVPGDARSGQYALKATIPPTMLTQGVRKTVRVAPGNRYRVTAYARGEGEIRLSAEGQNGWVEGNPVRLTPQWQKLSISVFVTSGTVAPSIVHFFGSPWLPAYLEKEHKTFSFFVDDFEVAREAPPAFPEVDIAPVKIRSADYCSKLPNAMVVADASGLSSVEVKNGHDFVRNVPCPRTVKPFHIYLKLFVEDADDGETIRSVSYRPGQGREPAFCARIPAAKEWVWLKTGPFPPGELSGEGFAVFYSGAAPRARLQSIVIATAGDLTDRQLEQ